MSDNHFDEWYNQNIDILLDKCRYDRSKISWNAAIEISSKKLQQLIDEFENHDEFDHEMYAIGTLRALDIVQSLKAELIFDKPKDTGERGKD